MKNRRVSLWHLAAWPAALAGVAWAAREFWRYDEDLSIYDPRRRVLFVLAWGTALYAALSMGMELMKGIRRLLFPLVGFALWGGMLGDRMFAQQRTANGWFALSTALFPMFLFCKAAWLLSREVPAQGGAPESQPANTDGSQDPTETRTDLLR